MMTDKENHGIQKLSSKQFSPILWAHLGFFASVSAFAHQAVTEGSHLGLAAAAAGFFAFGVPVARSLVQGVRRFKPFGVPGAGCLRWLYGCEQIIPNRKRAMPLILHALRRQIEKNSGRIEVVGVSNREFLHHRAIFEDGQTVLSFLTDKLNQEGCQVEATFIGLHPNCLEAGRRASIEKANDTPNELRTSVENFKMNFNENSRVNLGLYKTCPRRFILLTDDIAFVQYYLSAPPDPWDNGCFGDLTHVEVYPVGTKGYEMAKGEIEDMIRRGLCWIDKAASTEERLDYAVQVEAD